MSRAPSGARRAVIASALAAAATIAACGGGAPSKPAARPPLELSNAEIEAERRLEGAVVFPAAPRDADLVRVRTSRATPFDYFVDGRSIEVTPDRLVRFTLVARSNEGASNVSYVGLRCASRERRTYGFMRADGTWAQASAGDWIRLPAVDSADVVNSLWRDALCPGGVPPATTAEALRYLRTGTSPTLITQ